MGGWVGGEVGGWIDRKRYLTTIKITDNTLHFCSS